MQFAAADPSELLSDPGVRTDLFKSRDLAEVKLTDFFGGVSAVEDVRDQVAAPSPLSTQGMPDVKTGRKRPMIPVKQASESMAKSELPLREVGRDFTSAGALVVVLMTVAVASGKLGIGNH